MDKTLTMELTQTQRTALNFYEEHHSFVEGFGLTNLTREERLLYKKGRQLLEEISKAATRQMRGERANWTPEEVDFIFQAYLKHYDTLTGKGGSVIEDLYLKNFNNHETTNFIVCQIKFLDKKNGVKGVRHVTKLVADIAHDHDKERFRSYEEAKALSNNIEA